MMVVDKPKLKILVTGGQGFIGTHLVKKLKDLGHSVFVMDNKFSSVQDVTYLPSCRFYVLLSRADIVIHLAALAGVRKSIEIPNEYFHNNIVGTYNILTACKESGVKKFLFASSSSVYGNNTYKADEKTVIDFQLSPYAISKASAELVCRYFSQYLPVVVFRPFSVYGENGRPDMVVGKILGAVKENKPFQQFGNTERTYTNVHDLCDGIIKLLDYDPPNNFDIFNFGGKERTNLEEIVKIVKSQCPSLIVERLGKNPLDVQSNIANIKKANKLLGYSPVKKIKEEIIKLCQK
jgi:UDP-glucuronate 4-epimerase